MNNYQIDELKKYIMESELLTINNDLKLRLSKELLEKYNRGLYDYKLSLIIKDINKIKNLNLKYPANADPIFYLYVVPNENFQKLLRIPMARSANAGGGKPVVTYDLDSFNYAYGITSNILENKKEHSIMKMVNNIHELTHLVSSMFFNKNRFISEGFSEALPLYTMDYEKDFELHKNCLSKLKEEDIITANGLINLENTSNFDTSPIIPNTSISFELPYISSYLFVRGCIETIETKFNLDRLSATQKFLETIRATSSINQWLIYDIANAIDLSEEELLNGKSLQLNILEKIKNSK